MYNKAYGIIKTLAPLHVGATAGEESGNLNLIFRDQFTQTGIIPGSSIRGRLRAEMRRQQGETLANKWYGDDAKSELSDSTSESLVKLEYASIVWLPVFCPGQPIVWVSCPRLLKRYQRLAGDFIKLEDNTLLRKAKPPAEYTKSQTLNALGINGEEKLFFNFGFLTIEHTADLSPWFPLGEELPAVVVKDDEIAMIHDMALYRQSRVALEKDQKKVADKAFFNTEALPEETILAFPIALKDDKENKKWQPFNGDETTDIYLGGLESIGFGHCQLTFKGISV
ncbi:RAMP superfamily CRISPR-associated protein [Iningainema tapete]|uniref:Type III-B CRISPR module RAMP protein Cmr4 n=1 Tax=Iningainema tapete BLCC-T55 TaxID=2748662 RepID=A0A8J6XHX8_9CYAN|nr:RAMP superfamily CRISPR-associated protein [Iningainema tapete]MBD2772616.1 type III-B CRISPR module RAMP protein Cmr4 [Iningainema tapete BLCC-T55]